MNREPNVIEETTPAMDLGSLLLLLLAVIGGTGLALVSLPNYLTPTAGTLVGAAPKAFWYLSRASALVAYGLVWLSMLLGVLITNKLARLWPGGPVAYDLHQHASLLGLATGLFHALILLGDKYVGYTLTQILLPFASSGYSPFWVGLGQVAFYLLALVALSFYVRGTLGTRTWRLVHFLSFAVYALALLHGLFSGTDSAASAVRWFYWGTGGGLLFLTIYRVLAAAFRAPRAVPAQAG